MNDKSNPSATRGNSDAIDSTPPPFVLRCHQLRCRCDWADARIDLKMRQGEFHFLQVAADAPAEPLTRTLLGLGEVESGEIFFRRWQWNQLQTTEQFAARFRIARIIDTAAWIQNLQLHENIVWPMLHHGIHHRDATKRMESAMSTMAQMSSQRTWTALMMRLERSLTMRPAFVSQTVLRMAQWLRCLTFRPECVLAVRPLRDLPAENLASFIQCAKCLLDQGTAWLWMDAAADQLQPAIASINHHESPFHFAASKGSAT